MALSGWILVCTLMCNPIWSFPSPEDEPPLPQVSAAEIIDFYQNPRLFRNEQEAVNWLFAPDQERLMIGGAGSMVTSYDLGDDISESNRDFISLAGSIVAGGPLSPSATTRNRSRHHSSRQPMLVHTFAMPHIDNRSWDEFEVQARSDSMAIASERNFSDDLPNLTIRDEEIGCVVFQWTNDQGEITGSIGVTSPGPWRGWRRPPFPSREIQCAMGATLAQAGIRGGLEQPLSRITLYSQFNGHDIPNSTKIMLLINLLYQTELEPGMTRQEVLDILRGD